MNGNPRGTSRRFIFIFDHLISLQAVSPQSALAPGRPDPEAKLSGETGRRVSLTTAASLPPRKRDRPRRVAGGRRGKMRFLRFCFHVVSGQGSMWLAGLLSNTQHGVLAGNRRLPA